MERAGEREPTDGASDVATEATATAGEVPPCGVGHDAPPARDWCLDWDARAPVYPETVELLVPAKAYFYFKNFEPKDVKALRPQQLGPNRKDSKINGKDVWRLLTAAINNFYKQPWRRLGEDHVVVTETYKTSVKDRFPGDLHSAHGSQGLYRPIRSHLLGETADLDMKVAMPTILLWVCKQFEISCPCLEYYVNHREAVLSAAMHDDGYTKPRAKEQFNIAWMWNKPLRAVKNRFLRDYDAEAKCVEKKLMGVPQLAWILPFCTPEGTSANREGSFVSRLYHFVQARLMQRVMHLLREEEGERLACIVFDGLNVANKARHGDEPLLDKCTAACEEVCPGLNMGWAWKELDFEVRTKDTKERVPDRAEGKVRIIDGKLCIPDDYEPPEPGDEEEGGGVALDPRLEPTYDEQYARFSLPEGKYGKVGGDFIEVLDEDDVDGRGKKLSVYGKDKFVTKHEDLVYYAIETMYDKKGNETTCKKTHSFIQHWIKDPRKDAQYLLDPSRRCKWDYFDMHPLNSTCPPHCYNLWRGFAAEAMAREVDLDALPQEVAQRLERILDHFHMLCLLEGKPHEDFLLDWLAHLVQHPNKKVGIALCMVGKRGCGKTTVWEILERLVGRHASFAPMDPKKDAWGDNNDNMRTAFVVRIVEAAKKAFVGDMGMVRTLITEEAIRVRSLYGASQMVKSYIRFFMDTDQWDSIPDEDGERRFFVVGCNPEKIGDAVYWNALREAIKDDRVIRALYLTLLKRPGVKERYFGPDIPVGEYARTLKDANRPHNEKFLIWLVQQNLGQQMLVRDIDELYEKDFKAWKEAGGEFERSKASFATWLRLRKFELPADTIRERRVTKPKRAAEGETPTPSWVNGKPVVKDTKQVTEFLFNIAQLCEHYRIGPCAEPAAGSSHGLNLVDIADADSDDPSVGEPGLNLGDASTSHEGDGCIGGALAMDETMGEEEEEEGEVDEEGLAPEELGRRMHARGDAPPSPHSQNDGIRRGYEEAAQAAAAAAAAAAPAAQGVATATPIVVSGVSAGYGAHGIPQTQGAIDQARAERQQRQQANGKQCCTSAASVAGGPAAKKPRHAAPAAGTVASVALVHKGRVLLTREKRDGKSLLNLPGGKAEAGETRGQAAAREAHEETGMQLTERTRTAIAAIADWVECGAKQGRAGALTLADNDDPDGTVDARFNRTAANAQRGSKTVHEGLEWHALADVRSHAWRRAHMNFPGQHRAAGAMRALDVTLGPVC